MDTFTLLDNYLISNNEYEINLHAQIIETLKKNISKIYLKERSENGFSSESVLSLADAIKEDIKDYVQGFDDTNAGEILLFISNLPSIANEISADIEENSKNISGITQISARDKVNLYMKQVFSTAYETLYEDINDKQIGVNLYYQCEKFIDALVLEFKQNLMPMIDKNNLVYEDILYLRRHLINLANNNENFNFVECEKCNRDDCTYTICNILPRVNYHDQMLKTYKKQISFLNKKLNDDISDEDFQSIGTGEYWDIIKKLVLLDYDQESPHKKIQFSGQPKIFSIISAERFEKILKRRYTGEAYEKDKDIYYMLSVGINPYELFKGDTLVSRIDDIKKAYSGDDENQK